MNIKLKILLISALCAFSIWLLVSPTDNRIEKLRKAIHDNKLIKLTSKEKENFELLLNNLNSIVDVKQKIRINEISDYNLEVKNTLNFFIVSQEIKCITYCNKGNAIYDASLNAIFIDISLIRPDDWMIYEPSSGIQLNQGDLPFLSTYLTFIVLHELGHYKLHCTSAGFFDFLYEKENPSFRKMEAEADSFAIAKVADYLNFEKGTDYYRNIGQQIDLSTANSGKEEVATISLLEMNNSIILGMLYGISPYSPFFSDVAHPTYITRTKSLIKSILDKKNISPVVLSKAEFIYTFLDKLEELANQHSITTVSFPEPVLDVNFSSDGSIVAMPTSANEFYKIPLDKLMSASQNRSDINSIDIRSLFTFQIKKRFYDSTDRVRLLNLKNNRIFCLKEKELYELKSMQFQLTPQSAITKLFQNLKSFQCSDAFDAKIIIQDSLIEKLQKDSIIHLQNGSLEKEILKVIDKKSFMIDYFRPIFNFDKIGLLVYEIIGEKKFLCGISFINRVNLSFVGYLPINLPEGFFKGNKENQYDEGSNLILFDDNDIKNIFISKIIRKDGIPDCWQLFRLSVSDSKLYEGKCFAFLSQKVLNKYSLKDFDPRMYRERFKLIAKNKYFINFNADCVFQLDLDKQEARTVFFPGDENLHMRVNTNNDAVLFISGLKKIFFLHQNKN